MLIYVMTPTLKILMIVKFKILNFVVWKRKIHLSIMYVISEKSKKHGHIIYNTGIGTVRPGSVEYECVDGQGPPGPGPVIASGMFVVISTLTYLVCLI